VPGQELPQQSARAHRVLGKTIFSAEAGKAGDAITEEWDLTPRLGEISVPTLILVGRDDFTCPPSQAKIMQERIRNSEMVVLEASGHVPYVEEPEAFSKRSEDGYGAPEERYSPECVEKLFGK
jgi:pimeloyl-ACP methyl ester carboxylesterase